MSRRHRLWALRLALRLASLISRSNFSWVGEPSACTELQGRGGAGIVQTDHTRLFTRNLKTREQESPIYSCLWGSVTVQGC